uniref:Uncharacterized protein n=1 Tax=Fagus sylvatica TaxID=28930 RepID=A0A2N9EUZ0_FAGSY
MASRIIPGEEKQNLLGQVPPISMSVPNPLTTTSNIPPSTISQNAFASDDTNYVFPLLRQKLAYRVMFLHQHPIQALIFRVYQGHKGRVLLHILSMLNKADVPPSAPNSGHLYSKFNKVANEESSSTSLYAE